MVAKKSESEAVLQKAIIEYLGYKGHWPIRVNSGLVLLKDYKHRPRAFRGATAGTSDILVCLNDGRFAAIEVKGENGRLTPLQEAFLEEIEKRHGVAILARSVKDVEDAGL